MEEKYKPFNMLDLLLHSLSKENRNTSEKDNELVRVEQVYDVVGEEVRVYSLITKQANNNLLKMLKKEANPVSNERMNDLIDIAAEKFPVPGRYGYDAKRYQ